jgi:glyoxylate/hydroxypyruvate reductase A
LSTLLIKSGGAAGFVEWQRHFAELAPGLTTLFWDDARDADYALVWDPEPGRLATMPSLRCIFGAGAGVDGITRDPDWPRHIPLVRMTPAGAAQRMAEYVGWAALHLIRGGRRMALQQARAAWEDFEHPSAPDIRVGIMGLGVMGARVAQVLRAMGFPVMGWSRAAKGMPGIAEFHGNDGLAEMLTQTDMLICLLPATAATRRILSAPLLAQLPRGAMLINAARGWHQELPDILAALDSGQLSQAVLDVFDPEPLPADSRAWRHPNLTVTPHVASLPSRRERAAFVAQQIAVLESGGTPAPLYDPEHGY